MCEREREICKPEVLSGQINSRVQLSVLLWHSEFLRAAWAFPRKGRLASAMFINFFEPWTTLGHTASCCKRLTNNCFSLSTGKCRKHPSFSSLWSYQPDRQLKLLHCFCSKRLAEVRRFWLSSVLLKRKGWKVPLFLGFIIAFNESCSSHRVTVPRTPKPAPG